MESGNLLMMEWRADDSARWIDRARASCEAGDAVLRAAEAHDSSSAISIRAFLLAAIIRFAKLTRVFRDPLR